MTALQGKAALRLAKTLKALERYADAEATFSRALKGFASVAGDGHGDDVPTQVPTTWLGALGAGSVHAFARDSEWLREHR